MNRAVVIKTVGDPQIAGAILDGMTQRVIPLDDGELAAVKAEYARLRAKDAVRAYGDEKRFESVSKALAVKYSTPTHGRLYGAILGVWALLWLSVREWYEYFSAWNREGA
jgi:hypothetical protein